MNTQNLQNSPKSANSQNSPNSLDTQSSKRWFTGEIFSWSLFDFAGTIVETIVFTLVFAVYFKEVVANKLPVADFYWALGINISMILVAFLSPILGAVSDFYQNKKMFLGFFSILCAAATFLMYFIQAGMILQAIVLFILFNIGYQTGLGFYNAFIKEITIEKYYNIVSSTGYAIGYVGSLAALAIAFIFKDHVKMTFLTSSMLFILFSLPLFIFIKERSQERSNKGKKKLIFIKIGIERIISTFKQIRNYSNLRKFLISYFLFIDGINTIKGFSANFATTTLNFSFLEVIIFFVIVQITALGGSFGFSFIADAKGTQRTLSFTLLCWMVLTSCVFFCYSKLLFMIIGGFAGLFLGSSQALSRSLMSKLTPDDKKAEFFGFFSLFEKTSTILGPLTFGIISWLTGNQRFAVISIIAFFIIGYFLLKRVFDPGKQASLRTG